MDIKIDELTEQCKRAVYNTEQSGVRKPALTVAGKLDQAQKWLSNLDIADKGLGECLDKGKNLGDVGSWCEASLVKAKGSVF